MQTILPLRTLAAFIAAALLVGCGGPRHAYKGENFSNAGPFERHLNAPPETSFAAMKKIVLRQGYTIEKQEPKDRAFVASKQFQNDAVNIMLTVSGIASGDGRNGTSAWMAAQEAQFVTSEQKHTASMGNFLLSIPVPTGSTRTVSKDRGETITDKEFYDRLFLAIESELPAAQKEIAAAAEDEDARMRAEIEKRLRAEMEIKAKLEQEARTARETSEAAARKARVDSEVAASVGVLPQQQGISPGDAPASASPDTNTMAAQQLNQ